MTLIEDVGNWRWAQSTILLATKRMSRLNEDDLNGSPDQQRAIREVLSYFVGHPQAADGLESIARWRLLGEVFHRRVDETRDALAWLVELGFLTETASSGVSPIYRMNLGKFAEAKKALADMEKS